MKRRLKIASYGDIIRTYTIDKDGRIICVWKQHSASLYVAWLQPMFEQLVNIAKNDVKKIRSNEMFYFGDVGLGGDENGLILFFSGYMKDDKAISQFEKIGFEKQ